VKISFYVSDHGYGHATRSIAVARALVAAGNGGITLELVNHHAASLLRRSLETLRGVSVVDRRTDVGFVCREDRLAFDKGRTALNVWSWISGWKRFVAEEVARLRDRPPDLVLTDVAPEPLLVAEKLGARSVVLSNFTWVDQYQAHLRPDMVAPIRGSYALAERAHAYSMRTALAGVRNIVGAGLVTREPCLDREEVRRRLGVGPGERLVHLGFGWSADAAQLGAEIDAAGIPAGVRLLVSSNLAALVASAGADGRLLAIPEDDTEAHESIAACDLVIGKGRLRNRLGGDRGPRPHPRRRRRGLVRERADRVHGVRLGIGERFDEGQPLGAPLFLQGVRMLRNLDRFIEAYWRLPAEFAPGAADRLARTLLSEN
jgi:hypothetical protein